MPPIPQNLINLYETRTMIPYLAINPGVPMFLRNRLFTNVRTFDTKTIEIDIKKGGRDTAVYVDRKSPGNLVEHDGYVSFAYKPPYSHEYKVLGPDDFRFREPGENVYNYTPPAQQFSEKVSEDFADLDTRGNRLEELQAVDLVTTGKVIPRDKDGNAFPEIDYGMRESHKPVLAGTALWTDPSVKKNDIIEQMEDWNTDLLVRDGTRSVGLVIMGRNAKKAFIRKMDPDDETAGLNSVRVSRGEVDPIFLPEGIEYVGRFKEIGNAPIYCYTEWVRDPWTKQVRPLFPENMVIMVGNGARFDRNYGFIENMNALRGLPRFPWMYNDPRGKGIETHLEFSPLLSLYEVDAIVAATVTEDVA
ncbi:major capsid protein [Treponema primitia]|uniref:major capsid protein n=1 Tax=Treponema primitia TaxID=88058 RepID=UPI00397EA905